MNKELILAIAEHRIIGDILQPLIISSADGGAFYNSIELANLSNIKELSNYEQDLEKIVQLALEYDDAGLSKAFNKGKDSPQDYLKKIDNEFIQDRIRPYVERRMLKMVELTKHCSVRYFLKQRGYSQIYAADEIKLPQEKSEAVFNFTRNEDGIQYNLEVSHKDEQISLRNSNAIFLVKSPCIVALRGYLYQFDNIDSKKLLPFLDKEHIKVPKQTEKTYFEKFILNTVKNFKVNATGFKVNEMAMQGKASVYFQDDLSAQPALLLKYAYNHKVILPNNPSEVFVSLESENDNYTFTKLQRDISWEAEKQDALANLGLKSNDATHFKLFVDDEPAGIYEFINWMNQNGKKLREAGFSIHQEYYEKKYFTGKIDLDLSVSESNDWFDIKGKVQLGEFEIPFIRFRSYILEEVREYELPDGSIAILPKEWFVRYKHLLMFVKEKSETLQLSKLHAAVLDEEEVGLAQGYYQGINNLISGKDTLATEIPQGLQAKLRNYQLLGYQWMHSLKQNYLGGILADDMGLGKTLQTLTLLLSASSDEVNLSIEPALKNTNQQAQLSLFDAPQTFSHNSEAIPINKAVSLIVMPASLIFNWKNEIEKFAPGLKVFLHVGQQRVVNPEHFTQFDIVLTTYGVVRNDIDMLSRFQFYYIVLDESQAIKNPQSKIYKAVSTLDSVHKMVLTGTPIENSLTDLWAQMNFVNQGLLGNQSFFQKVFVKPIEKQYDLAMSEKLQNLINPFILRRNKMEVATELPPLTEQVRYCEMAENQRVLYEEEKSAVRNELLDTYNDGKDGKAALLMVQALNKLRQLANHPKMLTIEEESGKFAEVTRMLENVISEGHKVLMFSSFVKHLSLYEEYLQENNLKYSILTGQTRDREQVIKAFQEDDSNQVFLISLKAGGVGLNLTAADYVFMLDPWWNPAAENQAIARAHRIGQKNKVFVYRFISADTIEEKIIKLQEKKSELAQTFVEESNAFKALSEDDVKALFE